MVSKEKKFVLGRFIDYFYEFGCFDSMLIAMTCDQIDKDSLVVRFDSLMRVVGSNSHFNFNVTQKKERLQ